MVSTSICEHASTAFYFASTSSGQIRLASSEHSRKMQLASSEHLGNSPLAAIPFFKLIYTLCSGVLFQSSCSKYCLKNNTYVNFCSFFFFLVCFQLNLTVRFHKEQFTNFRVIEQISKRIRACEQFQKFWEHEQASTRLNFASKSSKDQILRALEDFQVPFNTPKYALIPPVSGRSWIFVQVYHTSVVLLRKWWRIL